MLWVCLTCPRHQREHTGDFGAAMRLAVNAEVPSLPVRSALCLGGCTRPGVIAFDAPGKARVRFTGLSAVDAFAVASAAQAYDACATGVPGDWELPASLATRLSAVTPSRGLPSGCEQGRTP